MKASVQDFCNKTLHEKRKKPYDLISDLIGKEHSGDGNLAINAEEILRKRFNEKSGLGKKNEIPCTPVAGSLVCNQTSN